jgi:FAD synthetase
MTRVVATGTFDILHPGHVLYLSEARKLGDELFIIVARDSTIKHKRKPLVPESQRLFMVRALKCVDHAMLGSEDDMFKPIRELDPDIIALGFDQHWDEEDLQKRLKENGLKATVVRITRCDPSQYASSRHIRQKIKESDS